MCVVEFAGRVPLIFDEINDPKTVHWVKEDEQTDRQVIHYT